MWNWAKIFIVSGFMLLASCGGGAKIAGSGNKYLAHNLWFEGKEYIYCVNYKKGNIIPAGTEVKNIRFGSHRRYKTIEFNAVSSEGEKTFIIMWNPKFHKNSKIENYAKVLFTDLNFYDLTNGLTSEEIEAIKKGQLINGMSKKAVKIAWGPPPEHLVFDLNNDQWIYLTSKFVTKTLYFKDGKTVDVHKRK
ncbi:MAG: hypothetical protein JXB25_08645 [Deltaproteobacteria bacterium]|nr:hypothetical protein [Deltaproteobacteria bacterium]